MSLKSNRNKYKPWSEASSHYIRDYAYENGDYIYKFMKKHGIGESDYGKYMDALGRKPGVFHHRLYGHHPIYDFPFSEPEKIPDFLEHLFSDFFTKQGLPIIPGEIIESTEIKVVFNEISLNWNFINGFDLLAGTLAVYNSYKITSDYFNQNASIEKFDTLGKKLGISGIHVALALSTSNPLLIISSIISTAGTLVGVLNCPHKIYFKKIANQYSVVVAVEEYNIDKVIESYDIDNVVKGYDIDNADY